MHSVLQGSGPAPPSCRGIRFIAFVKYILPTHGLLLSKMDSCGLKWASVAGEDAGVDVGGARLPPRGMEKEGLNGRGKD